MKTCVFIIGGNLAGKSTLARALALGYGGLGKVTNLVTLCRENCCLAGKYTPDSLHGGVDRYTGWLKSGGKWA